MSPLGGATGAVGHKEMWIFVFCLFVSLFFLASEVETSQSKTADFKMHSAWNTALHSAHVALQAFLYCLPLWLTLHYNLMFTLLTLLQLALHEPPPKRRLLMMKTKTRTLGTTTASLMMTARIWAMTQTTSLLAQTTAVRRTSKDYRRKRRPLWRGGSRYRPPFSSFCCLF